jgi:hypothetical protein
MNLLFDKRLLKWPKYYNIYACGSQRIYGKKSISDLSPKISRNKIICFDLKA